MAERRRRMLPVALVALIPLLGWWLYQGEPRDRGAPPAPEIAKDRVSYYLLDMSLTATRADGGKDYHVTASRMRRFDDTRTWTFRDPRWTLFMADGAPWHGEADFGRAWNDGDEARLSGTVRLRRPATADARPMEVVTSEVYLRPRADFASTDRPVVASSPGMRMRGIGAEVYMDRELVELQSHVEGLYDGDIRIDGD